MQHYFKWIFFIITSLAIVACSNPHSPKGVAKSFWDGVLAQDEAVVKQYSSAATQNEVNFSKNVIDWKEMRVRLGTTQTVDDTAIVHTTVQNKSNGIKYTFNTYLVKEQNGEWRIDYTRTRKASITSEIFTNLIDNLQKLNQSLNQNYDDTVAGFKEASPEIKIELDHLSETLSKHIQPSTTGQTSDTHKSLNDFKTSIMNLFTHEAAPVESAAPAATQTTKP